MKGRANIKCARSTSAQIPIHIYSQLDDIVLPYLLLTVKED